MLTSRSGWSNRSNRHLSNIQLLAFEQTHSCIRRSHRFSKLVVSFPSFLSTLVDFLSFFSTKKDRTSRKGNWRDIANSAQPFILQFAGLTAAVHLINLSILSGIIICRSKNRLGLPRMHQADTDLPTGIVMHAARHRPLP